MKQRLLFAFLLLAGPLWQTLGAQTPDCVIPFTFNAANQRSSITGCGHNIQGVIEWRTVYSSTGFSALSLQLESAPDNNGIPGAWGAYNGTILTGINPNTATDYASTDATGYNPWVSMFLTSVTGGGKVSGTLYGCRQPGCAGSAAGAMPPPPASCDVSAFPGNSVVFVVGGTCVSDPNFLYNPGSYFTANSVFNLDLLGLGGGVGRFRANGYNVLQLNGGGAMGSSVSIDGYAAFSAVGDSSVGSTFIVDGHDTFSAAGNGRAGSSFSASGYDNFTSVSNGPMGSTLDLHNYYTVDLHSDAIAGATLNATGFDFVFFPSLGSPGSALDLHGFQNLSMAGSGAGASADLSNYDSLLEGLTISTGLPFASLGAPANGGSIYCGDCQPTSGIDNTCAAAGSGAYAFRINGVWKCTS